MTLQEINDQLELLRLKELFMSDIKIRSKMALLLSEECAEESEDEIRECIKAYRERRYLYT